MHPFFSIVLTAYNSENSLGKTVRSILDQDYSDYELIIVDDGSNDRTFDIARSMAVNNPQIHAYAQNNSGVSAARNHGMGKATGEYLLFVDCDDDLPLGSLREYKDFLDEHHVDICFAQYIQEKQGKRITRNTLNTSRPVLSGNEDKASVLSCLFEGEGFDAAHRVQLAGCVWAKAYRLAFLNNNNLTFDLRLRRAQDIEFNTRAITRAAEIGNLRHVTYLYYLFEGSHSHKIDTKLPQLYTLLLSLLHHETQGYDSSNLDAAFNIFTVNSSFLLLQRSVPWDDHRARVRLLKGLYRQPIFRNALKALPIRSAHSIGEFCKLAFLKLHWYSLLTYLIRER